MKKFLGRSLTLMLACGIILMLIPTTDGRAATVKLNKTVVTMEEDSYLSLKLVGASSGVKWKSDTKSVAKVSSKGKVTAVSAGEATVTATYQGMKFKCRITVVDSSTIGQNGDYLEELISKQYEEKLRTVVKLMLSSGAKTETCGNLLLKVWHNSIYEIRDDKTDKFTLSSPGIFYDNFNDALANLYADEDFSEELARIKEDRQEVKDQIRELKNPPKGWENAYTDLLKYYDAYYDFTDIVIWADCSLTEFKELFPKYDAEAIKCYDKMGVYFDTAG